MHLPRTENKTPQYERSRASIGRGLGQGPAGAYVAALSRERQLALRERLRRRLLGNEPDRPIEMQARAWAAKGTIPLR